jgi:hypothetical protein
MALTRSLFESDLEDTRAAGKASDEVSASFDRLCLAERRCGWRAEDAHGTHHVRSGGRRGQRWGRTKARLVLCRQRSG